MMLPRPTCASRAGHGRGGPDSRIGADTPNVGHLTVVQRFRAMSLNSRKSLDPKAKGAHNRREGGGALCSVTVNREIWGNSTRVHPSRAPAFRAGALLDIGLLCSKGCISLSRAGPMRQAPDRPFRDQQKRLAEIERDSAVLDSRVMLWCTKLHLDPSIRYEALTNGRPIAFVERKRGHVVMLHKIYPEELM